MLLGAAIVALLGVLASAQTETASASATPGNPWAPFPGPPEDYGGVAWSSNLLFQGRCEVSEIETCRGVIPNEDSIFVLNTDYNTDDEFDEATQAGVMERWASVVAQLEGVGVLYPECGRTGLFFLCATMGPECSETDDRDYALTPYPCRSICENALAVCLEEGLPQNLLEDVIICDVYSPGDTVFFPSLEILPCSDYDGWDLFATQLCPAGFTPLEGGCEPNCPILFNSQSQEDDLNIAVQFCAWLSLIGSIFCVTTWTVFPAKRQFPSSLVLWLSICSLGVSFAHILNEMAPTGDIHCKSSTVEADRTVFLCALQALLIQYFLLAGAFWWLCLSFNVFQMVVRMNRDSEKYERFYHYLSWGAPVLPCLLTLSMDYIEYSHASRTCFISEDPVWPQTVFFFMWIGIVLVLGNLFMALVIYEIIKIGQMLNATSSKQNKPDVPLRTVIFIIGFDIIMLYMFSFKYVSANLEDQIEAANNAWVDCFIEAGDATADCDRDTPLNFTLVVFNQIFVVLQGFWVFLLFAARMDVFSLWWKATTTMTSRTTKTMTGFSTLMKSRNSSSGAGSKSV